ncbi:hypothetical protein PLESTB_000334500 [Pleodorina starrii]|uniref:Uncharacterized protein n=1 Tax=Pleodorina starrii TaxID=330485 RepID=A0A9W6BDA4_9CHLO|nr:hypothetical protein PLESTM_001883100 [Pleodorina starrii]GLC50027.1 hypothetical protein PLESTB_000334500 [Pleodorina starrii]GLC70495.1 hypothetical protein PLESTF_000987700 [Pleodorina starrii]
MKALPRTGFLKFRGSSSTLAFSSRFGRQHYGVRRLRPVFAAAVISPELTEDHSANEYVSNEEMDAELFSTQALVADYQYALRFYRALKHQVGAWQSAFLKAHGRHPTAADAEAQHGHEFALLYSSFLEVRTRLLVELPRLKDRLTEGGGEADSGAQHPHRQPKQGGDRHSVNANSPVPGAADAVAQPAHPQQQQQVDSVSTWLRADRYRRQRAVAAAAAAAAAGAGAATLTDRPTAALSAAGAVRPESQSQSPPPASAGQPSAGVASPLQTASQQQQELGGFSSAGPGAGSLGPAAAPVASAAAAGLEPEQVQGWAPYQPVIQLTPLRQRLPAAEADARLQGDAAHRPGQSEAEAEAASCCSEAPLEQQLTPPEAQWGASMSLRQQEQGQQEQGQQQGGHQGSPAAAGAVPSIAAAAAVQLVAPAVASSGAGHRSASRLAEDASLAADSRARNALFAALQYKRTGRAAGASAQAQPQPRTGPGAEAGAAGHVGEAEAGEAGGGAAVVGEVQRGDAAGAYAGRNRRSDALPEAFMVCP